MITLLATLWQIVKRAQAKIADVRSDGGIDGPARRHAELSRRINESIAKRQSTRRTTSENDKPPIANAANSASRAVGALPNNATSHDDYMQAALKEVMPLFKECYTNAQKTSPDLGSGTLNIRFVVAGDSAIGGIIESSEITPGTAFSKNEALSECIKESVYSLRLPPPADYLRDDYELPLEFGPAPAPTN